MAIIQLIEQDLEWIPSDNAFRITGTSSYDVDDEVNPLTAPPLDEVVRSGDTTGTYSIGVNFYRQTNPIVNSAVSGTFSQNLKSNTYIYTLSGNTTFNYTNATYSTYNFVVKAGTFSFTLNSAGAWQTVGATGLGLTGSFIMSMIYDGVDMWVSSVKNYSAF